MTDRLLLRGGRLVDPARRLDRAADLLVEDGRIAALGPRGAVADARVLDCTGCVVAPGFVDLRCDLGEPGTAWREGFARGGRAAAAGGFTTLLVGPEGDPVVDDPAVLQDLLHRAARGCPVDVQVAGALSVGLDGAEPAEAGLLVDAGAAALSDGERPVADSARLERLLRYAGGFGRPILLSARDPFLERNGAMHEGVVSTRIGLRGLPAAAEEIAVARVVALVRATGVPVHVLGISAAPAVERLAAARAEGLPVTGSAPALCLLLEDAAVEVRGYDPALRLLPPLRSREDRLALVRAVREGVLSAVTTHHRPWTRVEKEREFERAAPGAVGLETALPALLEALGGVVPTVAALATGPRAVLGLGGGLAEGEPADLVAFDPSARWTPTRADRRSAGVNDPLEGRELGGRVRWTLRGGRVVHGPPTT